MPVSGLAPLVGRPARRSASPELTNSCRPASMKMNRRAPPMSRSSRARDPRRNSSTALVFANMAPMSMPSSAGTRRVSRSTSCTICAVKHSLQICQALLLPLLLSCCCYLLEEVARPRSCWWTGLPHHTTWAGRCNPNSCHTHALCLSRCTTPPPTRQRRQEAPLFGCACRTLPFALLFSAAQGLASVGGACVCNK